jgi:hypothetical protein
MVADNQVAWVWKNFCNGNSVTLQDNFCTQPSYPYWPCDDPDWYPFKRAMGVAVGLAQEADLLHMTPNRTIASTSPYCLFGASTGEAIIYQASGTITINLSTIADSLDVTWYDPDNFVTAHGGNIGGGTFRSLKLPGPEFQIAHLVPQVPSVPSVHHIVEGESQHRIIIVYGLPRAADVTLEIIDMTGRMVKRLVDSRKESGFHQSVLDSRTLSNGLYFYRLRAGDFVRIQKLLILKEAGI